MKRSIIKTYSKVKSKSRSASQELVKSLPKAFPDKKIPIAALTALSKKHSRRVLDPNSSFVKRLSVDSSNLHAVKLTQYLSENTNFQRGGELSEAAIGRAHSAFCNNQGKMTFEYILKKCEELGVVMTEKLAKGIVRKYGKGKDYISAEDCSKILSRRYATTNPSKRVTSSRMGTSTVASSGLTTKK